MPKQPLSTLTPEQARVIGTLTPAQRQALAFGLRAVRRQSTHEFLGLPWWSLATGPDPARGEMRGHAKGIVAIGDIATGVIAIGGWARGLIALGGLATGVVSLGGLALSLALSLGGLAISAGVAIGGGAVGSVAFGGGAVGQYAAGGLAVGEHVVSAMHQDSEAVEFFSRYGLRMPAAPRRR